MKILLERKTQVDKSKIIQSILSIKSTDGRFFMRHDDVLKMMFKMFAKADVGTYTCQRKTSTNLYEKHIRVELIRKFVLFL